MLDFFVVQILLVKSFLSMNLIGISVIFLLFNYEVMGFGEGIEISFAPTKKKRYFGEFLKKTDQEKCKKIR